MKPSINRRKLVMMFLGAVDVIVTIGTVVLTSLLINRYTFEEVAYNEEFVFVTVIILITWIILLKATHLARIPRTSPVTILFSDFIKLSLIGGSILILLDKLVAFDSFPSSAIFLFTILNFIFLFSIRLFTFKTVKLYRANGHNMRNVVILANDASAPIIEKILNQKEWGFRILYIITSSESIKNKFGNRVKVHSRSANIKSLLRFDIVDELICFDCMEDERKFHELIDYCSELGVIVRVLGTNVVAGNYKTRSTYIDNTRFTTIENNPTSGFYHALKSIIEMSISFSIIFVLSPILLSICIAIKLTSRGPMVFKQERVGLRGRKFYIYKFRTMVINAEELKEKLLALNESDGPTFKIKKDPRITPIGNLLRKTNLDELPQLFNVIKGEMSIIGPRPPLPDEVIRYKEWQLKRLAVKPGLTCTWQIVPNRNDVKFDKWVQMDIQYIDNWNLRTDVELFFKTFKTVLFARGA